MSEITPCLKISNLSLRYADLTVFSGISFALQMGEISCLLGPSGCGKTSLLRSIVGFETPSAGEIWITEKQVFGTRQTVAPEQRNVGMVFQDYALFPHLTVAQNIAFGLTHRSFSFARQRTQSLLDLVGLSSLKDRYPHQLSGGQQQRVALARAMAPKPNILLLDEPFSNLDVELREQLAKEVRNILKHEQITAILVSHNQAEAFALADKIGVMGHQQILQWDAAPVLYHRPISKIVADFIGEGSFIPGTVIKPSTIATEIGVLGGNCSQSLSIGGAVEVFLRPEQVIIDANAPLCATISERVFRGAGYLYSLRLSSGLEVLSWTSNRQDYPVNMQVGLHVESEELVVFMEPR